jgi:septum formation protein
MTEQSTSLILASASPYRRELLERIVATFDVAPSSVDESPAQDEQPDGLAQRLASAKAASIASANPDAVVIGSDQVASYAGNILGKPGNHANAAKQLLACSGRPVIFYTAVSVVCESHGFVEHHTDITTVNFRTLTATEIDRYLKHDQPWDCAGSFRAESLGVTLFESIDNKDPSAIIGLPLIWLAGSLRRAGVQLF